MKKEQEEIIRMLHDINDESDSAFDVRYAYQTVCDGVNFLKKELEDCKKNRRLPIPGWRETVMKNIYRIRDENIDDIEKQLKFFRRIKKDITDGNISSDVLYLINHLEVPDAWEKYANELICKKYQIKI